MLGFLAPAMLGLLALGAFVAWLHTAQPPRRIVSSMQIWLSLPDQPGAARHRWAFPKFSALLLLQLAALLALVLALSQPFIGAPPPAHLVVVIDGSGPMRAMAGEDSVFDLASADLVRNLADRKSAPPERVTLILATPEPRLIAARHAYEPEAMTSLLEGLDASDGPADWLSVARLVRQTLVPDESTAGLLVGGAVPHEVSDELEEYFRFTHLPVTPQRLTPELDVGLVRASDQTWTLKGTLRADPDLAGAVVQIGFTPNADIGVRPPLPWASLELDMVEGSAQFEETLTLRDAGLISVSALAEDRQSWPGAEARFITLPQPPQKVLYIAPSAALDQPLLRAIAAQGNMDLFQTDRLPQQHDDYALVIVDGIHLPVAPHAPTLWIGSAGVGDEHSGTASVADADFWHPFHPLTRSEDWTSPNFGSVATGQLPQGAEVLLSGASYPLMAVSTRGTWQDVHLKFDPRQVDWSSGDALPVLTGAITNWLGLSGALRGNCQVGLPCAVEPGTFSTADNATGFSTATEVFTPKVAGLFRDERGTLLAVNAAPNRFRNLDASTPSPSPARTSLGLSGYLLVAASLLLLADATLRLRMSGRRALPAFVALALVGTALAGWPFPLPFERTVQVHLVAEGGSADAANMTVAAGPAPRVLIDGMTPKTPLAPEARLAEPRATAITNSIAALDLAAALVPPYQVAEIVSELPIRMPIPTNASDGVWLPAHAYLRAPPLAVQTTAGPVLSAIALPAAALPGDRLRLTALVDADMEVPAEIAFHANGTQLAIEDVTLQNGMNRIETQLPPLAEGETIFTVTISTTGALTSTLSAIVNTRPGRPIIVLSPDPAHGEAFVQLATISTPGLTGTSPSDLVVTDPAVAPDYLRDWLTYDAIVLLNMPARAVTRREAGLIESAVTRHGLGLVILGGSDAFGPGGYFATPLEALSPLSARVPRDAPEVTMVFVLDRSGSMNQEIAGGTRLELVRQATQGAVGLLNPDSQVGIVVFDSQARVVLPLTPASDTEAVQTALAGVDTGGGTAIAPGIEAGWALLQRSDAQARHMIVMTDGLSLPGDFTGIASRMREEGITVSAVAVGTGADARAVLDIATAGGGSVHASDDFATLPSILSQEAMLLSSPVREGPGQPKFSDISDPLVRALPPRLPLLDGVVLTTAKPQADVALTTSTPDGDETPLLATWRYGNGNVLAFASDVTGPWSRDWQADPALAALWPHVLRQIKPVRPASGPWLSLVDLGESMQLTLQALDPDGAMREGLSPIATVNIDKGPPSNLELREIEPGIYQTTFTPETTGRIGAQVTLPGVPGPQANSRMPPDEMAETAFFRARPFWAAPLPDKPFLAAGGIGSLPKGWGTRLVPGLTTPWLVLALVAFFVALVFYMRPRQLASRLRAPGAPIRSDQGMTL
ncbi:von Willebrand factor type A domain-containing protein [Pelagibacterium luteolum]|uniref:von Willebrand factor type A domain-containing protein n=1 Tax=Pelagibacterium luteolum TaxID=440168 RepID=A0A1G7XYI1_9HYPH|nr:von Willebrand factor type A domain-containing protein [Pelagibacterium luteolum]